MLSPFLEAAMTALSFELDNSNDGFELDSNHTKSKKEALFNEILQNLPEENSTSNLFVGWNQASNTLEFEFDELLNLQ